MNELQVPSFKTVDEEAEYWDNLDTADYMPDDDQWFQLETPLKRAIKVAILPEIATALIERAHAQHVSVETLVNVLLMEKMHVTAGA